MTSIERVITLIRAVKYLHDNRIEGDIAECGVWRGGSMMVVAYTLKELGDTTRKLFLYDTFTGMSPATDKDKRYDDVAAKEINAEFEKKGEKWCYADLPDVKRNLLSTGYPPGNLHFVEGPVEETIPGVLPDNLCLLRLDTDWYESTLHEFRHLYPRLSKNGVLIIDDYGHWQGAKEATDEYFKDSRPTPFLHRIDYTGRLIVKG
jgi:O-methyltransferase